MQEKVAAEKQGVDMLLHKELGANPVVFIGDNSGAVLGTGVHRNGQHIAVNTR